MTTRLQAGLLAAALFGAGLTALPSASQSDSVTTTFFKDSETPSSSQASVSDQQPVELGIRIRVEHAGSITGIRFYKGAGNTGTHTGSVWSASGQRLRMVTFTGESPTGWQKATLGSPLPVTAGQFVTVSYFAPQGRYASTYDYFKGGSQRGPVTVQSGAGVYTYGSTGGFPAHVYRDSNYWVDPIFKETQAPPTAPPSSGTASCVGAPNTPGGPDPWGGCWPGPQNTGYPRGLPGDRRTPVTLASYTGPMTIRTCGVVIDSKIVTGDLIIQAGNGTTSKDSPCVTIKNSLVKGVIFSESTTGGPVLISDTEVHPPGLSWWENVGRSNFFIYRVNSHGSEGVIKCDNNCEAKDNWVHGMRLGGQYHYNAFGGNGTKNFRIEHNWASCGDWESVDSSAGSDAGCSAAIGFYGDFGPIQNVTIIRNFLAGANSAADRNRAPGYCLNPGYYPGKPYPVPDYMVITDNVFGRGVSGKCGVFGPTNSLARAGQPLHNVWRSNKYEDGVEIPFPVE